jgi:hypothetical protein
VYELWAQGADYEECSRALLSLPDTDPRIAAALSGNATWASGIIVFSTKRRRHGSVSDLPEKLARIAPLLRRLPGRVDLTRPEMRLLLLQDGDVASGDPLQQVYFVRELARGPRRLVYRTSLKTRPYVGTTTLDNKASGHH